jgi:MoxR-like ATPase
MPQLTLNFELDGRGSTVALAGESCTIGTGPENDIPIAWEASAEAQHAQLVFDGSNWWVRDLGGAKGTWVNGSPVTEVQLNGGDVITIGEAQFQFDTDAPAPAAGGRAAASRAAAVPGGLDEAHLQVIVPQMARRSVDILNEIAKGIVGQRQIVIDVLTAILARGHVLLIGMPGLAKTTLVRTISEVLDMQFSRIQFTPDLMPSDITGTDILEVDEATGKRGYRFIKGPIFTQILLADEINRTPPKTQAALLEAMQEYSVTASGHTMQLARPFFVLATQNPLEQEGTYPLPEAQLDRFMFSIYLDYPTAAEEEIIARMTTAPSQSTINKVMGAEQILELQHAVRSLPVSDHVLKYTVKLVRATRPGNADSPDFIKKYIHCGAGPRAVQNIIVTAKARAVMDGRLLVTANDVRSVANPVLRHRMFTNFTADSEGMDTDKIVAQLLSVVSEPGESDYQS